MELGGWRPGARCSVRMWMSDAMKGRRLGLGLKPRRVT